MSYRVSALLQAVSSGDQNAVSASLADGADVNGTNDRGQTPIIVAIISGHHHLLRQLLNAGANPLLADSTGLNAVEWAERKGRVDLARLLAGNTEARDVLLRDLIREPRKPEQKKTDQHEEFSRSDKDLSADEKSRRWLAGLKQRLDEKAGKEFKKSPEPEPEPIFVEKEAFDGASIKSPLPTVEDMLPATRLADSTSTSKVPSSKTGRSSSTRKRCPQCNATYDSELLAYCAHHIVPLVDADAPVILKPAKNSAVLVWALVLITLSAAVFAGVFLSRYLFTAPAQPASAPPVSTTRKGIPAVDNGLVGKTVSLPPADVPFKTGDEAVTITVHVKIDKNGRVYSALSAGGDRLMRQAAIDAAKKSTFAVQKLGGRGTEGTITYTFPP